MKNFILSLNLILAERFYNPFAHFHRILLISFSVFIILIPINAQNQSPVVTNVTFSQRTDGSFKVDVYYNVNDPEGNVMTVSMQVSSDNGTTWNFSCNNITGDVGTGITNGTNKHIVWDFAAEHPQTFGDQFRIKIIANDGIGGSTCPGLPTVTYAGKTYNTVQIGSQCWLRENLDVGTMILGSSNQANNGIIEKYCYGNNPTNCNTYGGLYQWNEAMQYVTTQGTRGICPTGWHIPTRQEFQILSNYVGGSSNSLKAVGQGTGAGAGTNTSGFAGLLSGERGVDPTTFNFLTIYAFFWTSSLYSTGFSNSINLYYSNGNIGMTYTDKRYGISVRCLKD